MEWLPHMVGGVVALAATLIGLLVRRLFKSIDLLFLKYDRLRADVDRLKLAMVAVDPSKTTMLKAFLGKGEGDG